MKSKPNVVIYLTQTDFNNKNVAAFWTYANDEGTYEEDFITQAQNAQALPSLGMAHVNNMHSSQIEVRIYVADMEAYDTIILPLCTHEGSGLGVSELKTIYDWRNKNEF